MNPNNLRLIVAGPALSLERFLRAAAAKTLSSVSDGDAGDPYWLERRPLSWRVLARDGGAKPSVLRGLVDPDRAWVGSVLESKTGMQRAAIYITDQAALESNRLVSLLQLVSRKHRRLCFVLVWQDPDTMTAGSALIVRGKFELYELSEGDTIRLGRVVSKEYGVSVESDDDDEAALASEYLDSAQMDACEGFWNKRIGDAMRLLNAQKS